ncbi:MAG: UDP-2,3-diacylglucosamine diphosphatase [Deltaproteobacteria bacterium]|nr:UDP-2,3-diacylglucosamine diphosphatase [Deltaproteobacteria bacterium]
MKAIFLSDVHLKDPEGADYERLILFFDRLRGRGKGGSGETSDRAFVLDRLVIAGDFFDFWFGKDEAIYPGFRQIIDRMAALKGEGVRISLCEGNHDFFLSDYFSRKLGFDVHPEWAEFNLDGLRVLASHGDTVDTGDHSYLALRRFLRNPLTHGIEQRLPRFLIWRLARFWSKMSREACGDSREKMRGAMERFAAGKIREGYDAVILGHCHEPLLRQMSSDGRETTFVTLGDWTTHGSYLLFDDGRFTLQRFPPRG